MGASKRMMLAKAMKEARAAKAGASSTPAADPVPHRLCHRPLRSLPRLPLVHLRHLHTASQHFRLPALLYPSSLFL